MSEIRTLWKHQEKAVKEALSVDHFAFFHEMGTGKTGSAITVLRYLYARVGHVRKTIIISPKITLQNWREEFKLFSRIRDQDILVLDQKTGAKKHNAFVDFVSDENRLMSRNRIIITNYETLQNENIFSAIMKWNPEIAIADESHRLKNHKSKRAKLYRELTKNCAHRYLMSGSPILNSAMDVFFPYLIMDGGKSFGTNFYAFRNRYFQDLNAGFASKPGYFPDYAERPEAYKELYDKMYHTPDRRVQASRVLKKDCLDLPPFVRTTINVEMGADQRKMYTQMKNEFLTWVEREKELGVPMAVVANLAITKALRLMQITSGFVKAEDGEEYEVKENLRLDALADLLEDVTASGKVIVWANFLQNHRDIARLCEKMGLPYRMLNGATKDKDKEMREFRSLPEVKVMIANQQAAGIGVNLVEAPVSIFYSRNFSLEHDSQAEARNYRGGSEQHQKVTRYDLVAKGTIDEIVLEALASKQNISDQILDLRGRI